MVKYWSNKHEEQNTQKTTKVKYWLLRSPNISWRNKLTPFDKQPVPEQGGSKS